MYGLLIENIIQYIQDNFGVDKWNEIRRQAQIEETSFHTHTVYPDVYTKNIIDKACKVRLLFFLLFCFSYSILSFCFFILIFHFDFFC